MSPCAARLLTLRWYLVIAITLVIVKVVQVRMR
jgi:hypothetical protein